MCDVQHSAGSTCCARLCDCAGAGGGKLDRLLPSDPSSSEWSQTGGPDEFSSNARILKGVLCVGEQRRGGAAPPGARTWAARLGAHRSACTDAT